MASYENKTHSVTKSRHPDLWVFKNKKTNRCFVMNCSEIWLKEYYNRV